MSLVFGFADQGALAFAHHQQREFLHVVEFVGAHGGVVELAAKSTGRHRIIFTSKFCRHYAINLDRRVRFTTPEIDEDGILTLNLRTAIAIGKPRKHKRREP